MNRESTLAVAAHLLEYPHPRLAEQARAAADWLDVGAPEAAALARRFADEVAAMSPGALEEAYTAAFDFASTGTIYAGEHLFGASEARATFLARLRVMQRDHGVAATPELPDHVGELLRLAAAMPDGDERDELLRDAVLPTARAALTQLQRSAQPFASALAAIVAAVETLCGAAAEPQTLALRFDPGPRTPPGSQARDDDAETPDLFVPSPEATP